MHTLRTASLRRDEEGFTLVELLVVALIIGVLATLAIPSFFSIRDRGWNAAAKSDVRNMTKIHTTLETNGVYAATVAELVTAGFEGSPDVEHSVCAAADDLGFAVAAKHRNSEAVWMIDFAGRLTEASEATPAAALTALPACGTAEVDPTP